MAVVRVRGEQLNITDVAAVLASDPAATEALAETFFPLTGGVIRGETILCYQEPCIWSWDPFLPCQDNLWRHVVKAPGNLTFSVNDISQSHLIINKIPGPPGVNAFVIVGNHTVRYSAGHSFVVCGTPPNDGVYKVVSGGSTFGGGNTTIPVVQQIPNISVPFGTVADFEFETEMLLMGLVPVPRVAVPTGVRLFADGGLEVNSFFDVFVDIDMGSNKITNLANGTVSGDALHFGQIGTNIQAFDSDLTAVAGLSSFGIAVRTATNTWATRTLVSTSGNITFVNPAGLAGDPNFDLLSVGTPVVSSFVKITTDSKGRVSATTPVVAGDITTLVDTTYLNVTGDAMTAGFLTLFQDPTAALHAATKGYVDTTTVASAGDTMTGNLVITGFKVTGLANGTLSGDALHFGQIGTQIQAWDTDLDGLAAVSSTGLIARTASGMFSPRTIMGTASRVTVVNGDGVAGNPTLNVAEAGIDHNLLLNYVANEHINHTSVTLTAGVGLNGGGDITVSRTFNVDAVKGTAAVTFGAIADGAVGDSTNTITATGAVIGDPVALGLPATVPAGFTYNAFVSAANTVMVRAANNGGGTGAGDANATMNVIVFQYAGF